MKRFLLLLLILALAATALFAGGAKESRQVDQEGVIRLRLAGKDFPADQVNTAHINRIVEAIYEKTGTRLEIELVNVPEGSYDEKLNLMILGGDIPDIIYFQGNDQAISNQGILEDLRPWVAKSKVMQEAMLDFNKRRIESYP